MPKNELNMNMLKWKFYIYIFFFYFSVSGDTLTINNDGILRFIIIRWPWKVRTHWDAVWDVFFLKRVYFFNKHLICTYGYSLILFMYFFNLMTIWIAFTVSTKIFICGLFRTYVMLGYLGSLLICHMCTLKFNIKNLEKKFKLKFELFLHTKNISINILLAIMLSNS